MQSVNGHMINYKKETVSTSTSEDEVYKATSINEV